MTTELRNDVLAMSLEWGPVLMIPLDQRVQERYPELTPEEIKSLTLWAGKASSFVTRLIEEDCASETKRSAGEIAAQIKAEYPEINEKNLATLHWQGMYSAWRG